MQVDLKAIDSEGRNQVAMCVQDEVDFETVALLCGQFVGQLTGGSISSPYSKYIRSAFDRGLNHYCQTSSTESEGEA